MKVSDRPRVRQKGMRRAAAAAICLLGVTAVACVGIEKRQVDAAREALDACEAEHGPDHPECKETRLRLRDAQERYEERAQRAWACDQAQEGCPTQR